MTSRESLAEHRQLVVARLRRELLGPADGPHELVIGRPSYRYLTGMLFPVEVEKILEQEQEQDEEHTPQATSSDEVPDAAIAAAYDLLPASMGISFYVEGASELRCDLEAGQYQKMTLDDLKLAERFRDAESVGSATWSDRSERLRGLEGSPILPGLARRLFELLGSTPRDALLLNAMLQLAPAHIQVLAAVMDRWYTERWYTEKGEAAGKRPRPSEGPEVGKIGGMPDSCYMWRRDGPLAGLRPAEPTAPGRTR